MADQRQIFPEVMLLEGDDILRRAITYGNICRALVEIDATSSFLYASENFLTAAREFAKHLKTMRAFAAERETYTHECKEAAMTRKKEIAKAIAENDAGGKV